MVTAPEAAVLLATAASFDNRQQNSAATQAWAEALKDVDFSDAQHAIVDHYRTSSTWIMPSDIVAGVKAIEAARISAAPNVYELEPPKHVTDLDGDEFDAAYMEWLQDTARRIRRGLPYETGTRAPAIDDPARVRELVAAVNVAHKAS